MPAGGSSIFTDAIGYQDSLRDLVGLLVEQQQPFHARLTWVNLPQLRLLRARESSPRVAFLTLPQASVSVSFVIDHGSTLVCDGIKLQFGDILWHGRGDRLHQRTAGPARWGAILLSPATLVASGVAVTGRILAPPLIRRVMRPRPVDLRLLTRLHAQIGRIAETAPDRIGHKEVVRAVEQDLLLALLNCLAGGDRGEVRQQPGLLVRLEALLMAQRRLLRTHEISEALGVSPRLIQAACNRVLGMSPRRYQRLRRLTLTLADLTRAEADSAIAIVRHHGFADVRGFAAEHLFFYGTPPPFGHTDG
jgi:AraC-like DNA-binding protein